METIRKLIAITLLCLAFQGHATDAIDINSASKEMLMSVNGVGERRAEAIIDYREKYGPFKSIDQLLEVDGIGQSTLDNNREILTIGKN